jgi:hypothetical protein
MGDLQTHGQFCSGERLEGLKLVQQQFTHLAYQPLDSMVRGGILPFELYRPSEGMLSRCSLWFFSTGVDYVPALGYPSSLLG